MAEEKRKKYRLALLEDRTLREVFHLHLNALGAFSVLTVSFFVLIALLSVLVIFTPMRNILPGYNESVRQQLIDESARVDSLQNSLALQRQYLDVIKQLTAGDIHSDSVQSLDSLQMVQRAMILEERSEATDEFVAQYEQKEKNQLQLFDPEASRRTQTLFRPVHGVVMQSADIARHEYGVRLRVSKNENVLSVLRGTVVYVERDLDNLYSIVVQHHQYVSIYRHVGLVFRGVGSQVQAGESLGMMNGEDDLVFEIWRAGQPLNPEEAIVFQ
ncbi:MAG: M23 family metallopeptidase [Paludibacteraceae bacterium]|nr:M23 family metallopeptidase [Paludibacteraceae bacterium]